MLPLYRYKFETLPEKVKQWLRSKLDLLEFIDNRYYFVNTEAYGNALEVFEISWKIESHVGLPPNIRLLLSNFVQKGKYRRLGGVKIKYERLKNLINDI